MSADSSIEWTQHTFNPWHGCTKVSEGCRHCYADALDARGLHGPERHWGPSAPRRIAGEGVWNELARWERAAQRDHQAAQLAGLRAPPRPRVFCLSMGDVAEERPELDAPRAQLRASIERSWLRWLLLSKRPQHLGRLLWTHPPEHVAYGASVESQDAADRRVPELLRAWARWHFLSVEPLLERVVLDLRPLPCPVCNGCGRGDGHGACWACHGTGSQRIDWVIVGGESGGRARRCAVDWIEDVVTQCRAAGVPVFVKQLGARPWTMSSGDEPRPLGRNRHSTKGGDPRDWPANLLNPDGSPIRELPEGW